MYIYIHSIESKFQLEFICINVGSGRTIFLKGRVPKKVESMVFCRTPGVEKKVFFSEHVHRITAGPPKHVLHLFWSAFVLSPIRVDFAV